MKIFGIGLSKTGTTSLARALEILGYRTRDCMGVTRYQKGDLGSIDLEEIERYDAFTDTPVPSFYRELDQRYPGSRFILTVREEEPWLASCRKQFTPRHAEKHNDATRRLFEDLYGTDVFDEARFRAGYRRFVDGVLEYFSDRPDDLLVIDVTAGEGWEKLCAFLGKPEPDLPFPRANVTRIRWITSEQVIELLGAAVQPLGPVLDTLSRERRNQLRLSDRLRLGLAGGGAKLQRQAERRACHALVERLQRFNGEIPVLTPEQVPDHATRRNWNHLWLVQAAFDDPQKAWVGVALVEDQRPVIGALWLAPHGEIHYGAINAPAFIREPEGKGDHPLTFEAPTGPVADLLEILRQRRLPPPEQTFCNTTEFDTAPLQAILDAAGCNLHDAENHQLLACNKPDLRNPCLVVRRK